MSFEEYPHILDGNTDAISIVTNFLPQLKARYVRLVPLGYLNGIMLRWNLVYY